MKNNKIYLFIPYFLRGGVERNLFNIASLLVKSNHDVSIVGYNIEISENFKFFKTISIIDYKESKVFNFLYGVFKLFKLNNLFSKMYLSIAIFQFNGILICFQSPYIISLINFLLKKFKIIIRESNTISLSTGKSIQKKIMYFLKKLSWNLADSIINVSNEAKFQNDLYLDYHKDNSTYIYNPCDFEYIKKSSVILDPRFDNTKINFVAVGRISYQKNYEYMIKIFNFLKNELDFNLHIIGDGDLSNKIVKLRNENGLCNNIYFHGHIDNPYPYINKCDFFILTSRYEGIANVLLEALTLRKNIITTKCPSGPKEIIDNGNCGIFINDRSASLAAEEIKNYVLDKNLQKLHLKNIDNHIKKFSHSVIAQKYENIFANL